MENDHFLLHKPRTLIHLPTETMAAGSYGEESFMELLREVATDILQGHVHQDASKSRTARLRSVLRRNAAIVNAFLQAISADIMRWINKGGPWRAWLATAVGAVLLLALAGLSLFLLFFVVATTNAVALAFLVSVASVGAFVGIFFSALAAIYIGALVVSAFAISALTLATFAAVVIAAGWVCFLWCVWRGFQKFVDFLRGSLIMTASVLAPISTTGATHLVVEKNSPK